MPVDAQGRLSEITQVAPILWPGVGRPSMGTHGRNGDLLIVPSVRKPRLLVPARPRRVAAAAVRYRGGSGLRAKAERAVLSSVLLTGLGPWVFRHSVRIAGGDDTSLVAHLSQVLNRRVHLSMPLSAPRANRKPVLCLVDDGGDCVAFAKIGVNDLTRRLVRREAEVLDALGSNTLEAFTVPRVLHVGTWEGAEVLVLSPLPTWKGQPAQPDRLDRAMRELAAIPLGPDSPTTAGQYCDRLIARGRSIRATASALDQASIDGLSATVETLRAAIESGARPGVWHGDWTPWNCVQLENRLLVWDWERCSPVGLAGFDALHFRLQQAIATDPQGLARHARDCIDSAARVLTVWELDPQTSRAVAGLYLVDVAFRYLEDDQRAAGGLGGAIESWILPALHDAFDTTDLKGEPA